MSKIFLQIVNMSITTSYVILFVLLARLLLKKAPKILSYSLWSVVLFRLVFPFSFKGVFSLISINTKTIPSDIIYTQTPQINSGIRAIDRVVNSNLPLATVGASANPMQIWIMIATTIWLIGIMTLVIYGVFTTISLSKRLKSARLFSDNIYITDNIKTAFVFGIINPKIYLPNNLTETERLYIIKHEQTHINRYDHIIKFVSFIAVSIHWFNPLAWIGFYLMSEDMELSCDEKVIKELGSDIKEDYSVSLLSLSTGKRIIGGSPLAFGSKNTKGRIKNILSYKKPQFWITLIGLILIIVVGVGLLTNPKDDEKLTGANKAIENVAMEFIDDVIAIHEEPENAWRDYKIIDSKITKLDKIVVLDNILDLPIEVWNLEFRLKPDDISKASYKTTVYEEDGWFTEDNGMGRRCLVILMDENNTRILGSFQPEEFDFDNLAKQEIRVRLMLAHMGLLPNGAYEGNHVVIKFPLSTDENAVLFLSQPVIQGDKGIWAVERWKDGLGFIHHEFPGIDIRRTDVRIDERYRELQDGFNNGKDSFLGDPIEVAMSFINSNLRQYYLRQIQVEAGNFDVIDPATMEDFVARGEIPEKEVDTLEDWIANQMWDGALAGYIVLDGDTLYLDEVEVVTLGNKDRMQELGLSDSDMPNGYHIHKLNKQRTLALTNETLYIFTDYQLLFVEEPDGNRLYTTTDKNEFIKYLTTSYSDDPPAQMVPFFIEEKDGKVISIKEEFIFTQ